jgi:hypothetical protein
MSLPIRAGVIITAVGMEKPEKAEVTYIVGLSEKIQIKRRGLKKKMAAAP